MPFVIIVVVFYLHIAVTHLLAFTKLVDYRINVIYMRLIKKQSSD